MINVDKFENRIVKFKRIDSDGNETAKHAEIRQIDYTKTKIYPVLLRPDLLTH